jgi:spermidine/putrescine-binding protein
MIRKLASLFTAACVAVSASVASAQDKTLNLFAWSEYVPQSVIDGFTAETGIKVNYETYASNEEMLSKLLAGATSYDLVQPSEYTIEQLVKQNQLAEVDWSKVPNVKNIDPTFRGMAHDPQNKYTVPWMAGTVGIVVNTDKVKDDIKGFKDVFQEKFKGRIVALDDNRELVTWALSMQGKDINVINKEVLDSLKPVLAEWVKLIKVYDSDSPKTALLNGDVDLGVVWSGEAALLYQEDKKFKYILPAEGTHMFVDSLAIPVGSKNKDNAMAFMNYILQPEVSKLISDDFPYTNPNVEARKLLTEEQKTNPASYPGEANLKLFHDIGPDAAAAIDQLVTDLRSGS